MTRLRGALLIAVFLVVAGAVALFWQRYGLERASWLAGVLSLLAGVLAVLLAVPRRQRPATVRDALDAAAADLAALVRKQWRAEVNSRELLNPAPIDLEWSPVPAPGEDPQAGGAQRRAGGRLTELVPFFRGLPARRLVVLGAPGSGKSTVALLLTAALLEDRDENAPVPVLLSLSTWNPASENFGTWLSRMLHRDYPLLGNTAAYGTNVGRELLVQGRVLPVLDGLDEIPERLRGRAIEEINRAVPADRPLVLLSREAEYDSAAASCESDISSAEVIALHAMSPDDARAHLRARTGRRAVRRWQLLLEHLEHRPCGPLALALSNPLNLWLARTAYAAPGSDPGELTDEHRFPTRASIEQHLLGALLPALLGADPAGSRGPRWRPSAARRWLSFLAADLQRRGTSELRWQNLSGSARSYQLALFQAVLFAGPITAALVLVAGQQLPVAIGLALTVVLPALFFSFVPKPASLLRPINLRRVRRAVVEHKDVTVMAVVSVLLGALGPQVTGAFSPGAFRTFASVLLAGSAALLFLRTLSRDAAEAPDPDRSFRLEARTFLAFTCLLLFCAAGTGAGLLLTAGGQSTTRTIALLTLLVFLGLIYQGWYWYWISALWLALCRRVPLRLMAFLTWMHRLGLLRRSGAAYQFRHAKLQEHLAAARAGGSSQPEAGAPANTGDAGSEPARSAEDLEHR